MSESRVQLVLYPEGQIHKAVIDAPDLADKHARAVKGVVVELPVLADYREPADEDAGVTPA